MKRRSIGALAVVALALALLGWRLWPTRPTVPAPDFAPAAASPTSDSGESPGARRGPTRGAPTTDAGAGVGVFLRVVSAVDQRPIAGAGVMLFKRGPQPGLVPAGGPNPSGQTTDADGVARFPEADRLDRSVGVQAPFFGRYEGDFVAGATVALKPLPPVRGIVLSASRAPVAGAHVSATGEPVTQTDSRADGRFELWAAWVGPVVAEKDGKVGRAVHLDQDPLGEVEIVLGAAPSLKSRVVGRDGKPIEGVDVALELGAVVQRLVTDGEGVWAIAPIEGVFIRATFTRPGYATAELMGALDKPWKDTVLTRPSRLEGRVVNPDQTPVAGATVELVGLPLKVAPVPVTTDAAGRFGFGGLGVPVVNLLASKGARNTDAALELPDGEVRVVTVVLRPDLFMVPLEVVDDVGKAVPTSEYDVVATPIPDQGWQSKNEGSQLPLARGRFLIKVEADGPRRAELTADVNPGPGMAPIRVQLPKGRGVDPPQDKAVDPPPDTRHPQTLKVRVRDAAGQPVEGAEVTCVTGSGLTDREGMTSCTALADASSWPMQVVATRGKAAGMTPTTGREPLVEVVIGGPRTVRGRVVGQLPASGVVLNWRSATQNQTVPLQGSTFELEGIDRTRTFICVSTANPLGGSELLGCTVVDGSDEAVITVGAPGSLELTVLDEKGGPLDAPIFYLNRNRHEATLGGGGKAHLQVPPGNHTLIINVADSRARYETFFTVHPGEVTQLGTVQVQ